MKPIYGQDVRDAICARLAHGEALKAICRDEGMPSAAAVLEWLEKEPEFADRYAQARARGYALLADELVTLADTPQIGTKTTTDGKGETTVVEGDMIEHRRLQIDTRKWMLAKMLPKVYGDKQQIEHSGSVSIGDTLREARLKRRGEG